MAKIIKINEQKLTNVISTALKNVLNEGNATPTNNNGQSLELSEEFSDGLFELKDMYYRLNGFVNEYNTFVQSIMYYANKLGYVLSKTFTEKYFDLDEAVNGRVYDFEFDFILPNVNVDQMSDEEYEAFEEKLESMNTELEAEIGKPSFGTLNTYTTENGINVYYQFKMCNKDYSA